MVNVFEGDRHRRHYIGRELDAQELLTYPRRHDSRLTHLPGWCQGLGTEVVPCARGSVSAAIRFGPLSGPRADIQPGTESESQGKGGNLWRESRVYLHLAADRATVVPLAVREEPSSVPVTDLTAIVGLHEQPGLPINGGSPPPIAPFHLEQPLLPCMTNRVLATMTLHRRGNSDRNSRIHHLDSTSAPPERGRNTICRGNTAANHHGGRLRREAGAEPVAGVLEHIGA